MQLKWLIAQLEEFSFQSSYQGSLCGAIREELLAIERDGIEHSARLDDDVNHLHSILEILKDEQDKRNESFRYQEQEIESAYGDCADELMTAKDVLHKTKQTQAYWEDQLTQAKGRLFHCQWELKRAISELLAAQLATQAAQSSLDAAESAYQRAPATVRVESGTDKNGNTKYTEISNPALPGLMNRVHSAQGSLTQARTAERSAMSNKNTWQSEEADASRWVQSSAESANHMHEAKKHADSFLVNAEDSQLHIKNARESLRQNIPKLELIDENLSALDNCIAHQFSCRIKLKENNERILNILNDNEKIKDELSYLGYKTRQVFDNKVNLLTAFDRLIFTG